MVFQVLFDIIKIFFDFIKYPLFLVLSLFLVFIICCAFWFIIYTLQGKRLQKGTKKIIHKDSFIKNIFYNLPRRFVLDRFEQNPDFFKYQGCIIFEGRQGAGKTMSMIEFTKRMQSEYPLAKCTTNLGYKYENTELLDWRMLLDYKNDIFGVIVVIDELQNWFSSRDSKDFPPEMLEIITQNRKNRRVILGTAQNFYLLAKAIRSQATEVRRCTTLLGALTIVRRFEPILDSDGNVKEFKKRGWYYFVHSKELRESYDTYKVIKRLQQVGFIENNNTEVTTNNYLLIQNKKKGLFRK